MTMTAEQALDTAASFTASAAAMGDTRNAQVTTDPETGEAVDLTYTIAVDDHGPGGTGRTAFLVYYMPGAVLTVTERTPGGEARGIATLSATSADLAGDLAAYKAATLAAIRTAAGIDRAPALADLSQSARDRIAEQAAAVTAGTAPEYRDRPEYADDAETRDWPIGRGPAGADPAGRY